MRFEIGMKAALLLGAVTLGSGGVLAAEVAVPALHAAMAQVQPAKHAPIKQVKKSKRADSGKKKGAQAARVVEGPSKLPEQTDAVSPTVPEHMEEHLPDDNGEEPLALKGVRG